MAGTGTFVWTEADYAAAIRGQTRLAITRRTWIVLALLAALGLLVATLPLLFGLATDGGSLLLGATMALFLPLCLLSVRWHAPRTARRSHRWPSR